MIEISEPATLITDYILSIVVLILGISLFRARDKTSGKSVLLWSIGFLTAAAAAAAGGTFHGFAFYFGASMHRSLWNVTVALIAASAGFVTVAVLIQSEVTNSQKRWLRGGILLTLVGVAIQRSGFSLAANFNYNDLYHCIQTVAFYLLFRAALSKRPSHAYSTVPDAEVNHFAGMSGGNRDSERRTRIRGRSRRSRGV